MTQTSTSTPEQRARKRVEDLGGLLWHMATFVIVNAGLWTIDLIPDFDITWAFWPTIAWGIGLIFHIVAYFVDTSSLEDRKYQQYLAEEQLKELQHH